MADGNSHTRAASAAVEATAVATATAAVDPQPHSKRSQAAKNPAGTQQRSSQPGVAADSAAGGPSPAVHRKAGKKAAAAKGTDQTPSQLVQELTDIDARQEEERKAETARASKKPEQPQRSRQPPLPLLDSSQCLGDVANLGGVSGDVPRSLQFQWTLP